MGFPGGGGAAEFFVRGKVILEDKASKVIDAVQNKMGSMGRKAMVLGSRIRSTGQSMTIGLTAPIIGLGVAIVRTAGQFGDEMAKIIGLSNTSAEQVGIWREELLQLAVTLGKAPQELAEGLFFLASAGLETTDAMELLEIAGRASVAGLGDVETIALALTNALNAYGEENLDAADAVGVMIAAVREGNLEVDTMAGTFGKLLPLASELGISFGEIAGAMSALSLINADANENATSFLGIMRAMIKPSQQGVDMLKTVGLTFADLRQSIDDDGLLTTLQDLRDRFVSIEDIAVIFPRVRGLTGLLNLTGESAAKVDKIFKEVAEGSSKDLDKAFSAAQTPAQNMRIVMVRLQVAMIRLEPVIAVMASVLGGLVSFLEIGAKAFAKLPSPIQKVIVIFALLLAMLGPLLIVTGALISAWGSMVIVIQPLIIAIRALGISVRLALGVIGLLVAAVTAVGVGLFFLVKWFRSGSDEAEEFDAELKQIGETAEILGLDKVVEQARRLAEKWIENRDAAAKLITELQGLEGGGRKFETSMGKQTAAGVVLVKEIDNLRSANEGLVEDMDATGIKLDQATIVADELGVSMGSLVTLWPQFGRAADEVGVDVNDLADELETAEERSLDWTEAIEGVAKALNTDLTDAVRGITDIETIEEVQIQAMISATELQIAEIMKQAGFLKDDLTPAQEDEIAALEDTVTALEGTRDWYDKTQESQGDLLASMLTGLPTQAESNELFRIMKGRLSDVDQAAFFADIAAGNLSEALENMSEVDPDLAESIRFALNRPLQEAINKAKETDRAIAKLLLNIPALKSLPGIIGIDTSGLPFSEFSQQGATQFVPQTEGGLRAPGLGNSFTFHVQLGGRATEADAEEFMDMIESRLRGRRVRFQ